MASKKRAITGLSRPAGIIDDVFGPAGKKAVQRVTKLAEKAAVEARKSEKAFAKYQRTGSAYNNFKSQSAREMVVEEFLAAKRGKGLKDARKVLYNTPPGEGYVRLAKDADKAISESRKVVDARQAARKTRRAAARKAQGKR